jgi:hypothetical protein
MVADFLHVLHIYTAKQKRRLVMTPIGGYFARETPRGELPCEGGVALNFGRGGLRCSDSDIDRIVELVVG